MAGNFGQNLADRGYCSRLSEGGRVVRLLGQPLGEKMGETKNVALLPILRARSECVGWKNGQVFPMERVEAVIMEVFISVFREKLRKIDFRLDFPEFFRILSIFGVWLNQGESRVSAGTL